MIEPLVETARLFTTLDDLWFKMPLA